MDTAVSNVPNCSPRPRHETRFRIEPGTSIVVDKCSTIEYRDIHTIKDTITPAQFRYQDEPFIIPSLPTNTYNYIISLELTLLLFI